MADIVINKIQFKRGLKANLPTLAVGEPAYCTDTQEFFVGTASGNLLINDHAGLIAQLADIASLNNYSVIPTYTNGQLTKVEEKDGSVVKLSSAITYNTDGTVNTITEVVNGKTVVSTLNYVNGEFSSVSRAVL